METNRGAPRSGECVAITSLRLDHVSIVVEEIEGRAPIEGEWVDRINALDGIKVEIAMLRTQDGHGKLELTKFHAPSAISPEPKNALGNTLGMRSILFEVEAIEATVASLQDLGGELIGKVADYEEIYRLCYMRGPTGIIVSLTQDLR